jgi:3-methyladenine DNA glycosylase/8-oxoguanine DNA glycosylase
VWHDQADPGPAAGRAFPTPEAMAAKSARFYEKDVRAGYRARALAELSDAVASGRLDPELWLRPDLSTAEIAKQILSVRGAGPYTAENLLKLLGRYDGLGLDSWTRAKFARLYGDMGTHPARKGLRRAGATPPHRAGADRPSGIEKPRGVKAGRSSSVSGARARDVKTRRPQSVPDDAIARHYERFGPWRGLAFWCDMTRDWHEDESPDGGAGDKF